MQQYTFEFFWEDDSTSLSLNLRTSNNEQPTTDNQLLLPCVRAKSNEDLSSIDPSSAEQPTLIDRADH
jgi:hypothetical protein